MSSQRKIDSSRANGALSRGAASPEGRARVEMAAVTHGLSSRRVVLDHESQEGFRALRELYLAELQPENPLELDLVEQLVAARWRLDRAWSIETALLDVEIVRQQPAIETEFEVCDAETKTALAFRALSDNSRALAAVSRYESRYRRVCERTLKLFWARRENRKLREPPNPTNEHPAAPSPP